MADTLVNNSSAFEYDLPVVIMGLTQMYPDNLYGTVKVMDFEYSEDTLELVMLNAVETNQIENVRITLSGSGCENPSKIPAWDSGETKTIRTKCDRKWVENYCRNVYQI